MCASGGGRGVERVHPPARMWRSASRARERVDAAQSRVARLYLPSTFHSHRAHHLTATMSKFDELLKPS